MCVCVCVLKLLQGKRNELSVVIPFIRGGHVSWLLLLENFLHASQTASVQTPTGRTRFAWLSGDLWG